MLTGKKKQLEMKAGDNVTICTNRLATVTKESKRDLQAKNLLVYLQHCLGEKENSGEKRIQESVILDREQDAGQNTIFATKQYSYLQSASYLPGTVTGIPNFLSQNHHDNPKTKYYWP